MTHTLYFCYAIWITPKILFRSPSFWDVAELDLLDKELSYVSVAVPINFMLVEIG